MFQYGNNKSRLGYDGHSLVRYPHYGVAGEIPVDKNMRVMVDFVYGRLRPEACLPRNRRQYVVSVGAGAILKHIVFQNRVDFGDNTCSGSSQVRNQDSNIIKSLLRVKEDSYSVLQYG